MLRKYKVIAAAAALALGLTGLAGCSSSDDAAGGTIAIITTPGLQPYSGDIIYVENRVPISRAADQIEDVKLIIQF